MRDKIFENKEAQITISNFKNSDLISNFNNGEEISIIFVSESNIILCSGQVEIDSSLELPVIEEPTFMRLSESPGET